MWKRKTTDDDKAYIENHPEMTVKALSERLGLSVRTIYTIRTEQTFGICKGRPKSCMSCPFPDCRLDSKAEVTEDEYKYIKVGMKNMTGEN